MYLTKEYIGGFFLIFSYPFLPPWFRRGLYTEAGPLGRLSQQCTFFNILHFFDIFNGEPFRMFNIQCLFYLFVGNFPYLYEPKYDNSHGQYVVVSEEAFPPGAFVHHVREVANQGGRRIIELIIVVFLILITKFSSSSSS